MNIAPGAQVTLGPYDCPVTTPGRVLAMHGHRHANTPRFSAWHRRGDERKLIYLSLDWEHPIAIDFNSLVENTAPDLAMGIEGGHSGTLELQEGDVLEWECEVKNDTDGFLRFTNDTFAGEMCILVGDNIGPRIACTHQ